MTHKKIVQILAGLFLIFTTFYACDDMNELHSEYLKGERTYIGRPLLTGIFPGKNKVKFDLLKTADPKATELVIYWNNKVGSKIVNLASSPESVLIDGLEEGTQNFLLVNRDTNGLESLPIEVSVLIYGDTYISGLLNRSITQIEASPDKVVISWSDASSEMIETKIDYVNSEGVDKTVSVQPEESSTEILDYVLGEKFYVSTAYKPDANAIENFFSQPEEFSFPIEVILDKSKFIDMDLPFDLTGQCWGGDINKLWDGTVAGGNYYHNDCGGDYDGKVHHFTIDLGVEVELSSLEIFPRQGCCQSRNPKEFQLWGILDINEAETTVVPDDPNWETNSIEKGWVNLLNMTDGNTTDAAWKGSTDPRTFQVEDQTKIRYVRFRMIETWDGSVSSALTELTFRASKIY